MFGSEILDVALGMAFIFLLLSLIASGVREAIESFVKGRAVFLERGIREMLGDKNGTELASMIYNHPHISSLFKDGYHPENKRIRGGSMPTYIPARSFAVALIDTIVRGPVTEKAVVVTTADGGALSGKGAEPGSVRDVRVFKAGTIASKSPLTNHITVGDVRENLQHLVSERLQRVLILALDDAGDDIAKVQANVETWFNETMDRVSGWYRRRTQLWLFIIAAVMVFALDIDTVALTDHLWSSQSVRTTVAARAEAFANDPSVLLMAGGDTAKANAHAQSTLKRQLNELRALELPIGWHTSNESFLVQLFGLLVTVFAISLGAPFWFDALKRIMVIRSTVKPKSANATAKSEASQGASGGEK